MAIPNKPTKYVHNFAKKYPKTQIASSQTGWRQSCSLKHTADQTSDQIQSTRRSGNYKPTLWDFDRIQSLTSVYTVHICPLSLCLSLYSLCSLIVETFFYFKKFCHNWVISIYSNFFSLLLYSLLLYSLYFIHCLLYSLYLFIFLTFFIY